MAGFLSRARAHARRGRDARCATTARVLAGRWRARRGLGARRAAAKETSHGRRCLRPPLEPSAADVPLLERLSTTELADPIRRAASRAIAGGARRGPALARAAR